MAPSKVSIERANSMMSNSLTAFFSLKARGAARVLNRCQLNRCTVSLRVVSLI